MGRLTDVDKGAIVALANLNWSCRRIAAELGFSVPTISLWVTRYRTEGHVRVRPAPGRLRITTPAQDADILATSQENHFLTAKQIRSELGIMISEKTITRRLSSAGLYARWAAKKEMMTDAQKLLRLQFAQEYLERPLEYWSRMVWTDEKVFSSTLDGRYVTYRARGLRHHPDYVKSRATSGRFKVTIWGWMTHNDVVGEDGGLTLLWLLVPGF